MSSTDILEWVMGWPWPVIIVFVILIAAGIERIISWDNQNRPEDQASDKMRDKECVCQCE